MELGGIESCLGTLIARDPWPTQIDLESQYTCRGTDVQVNAELHGADQKARAHVGRSRPPEGIRGYPAHGSNHKQRPQSKPKSADRSTRSNQHASKDTQGRSKGVNIHVVNQPKKTKKRTQRGRHRSRKESSQPPPPRRSKSSNPRPPLPPDQVLTRQGDTLHRELNRVVKNGRMLSWQQHIFAGAFRKIRDALLELGSRNEKGAPITETEHHSRAYAREAFDRFKMCMEKV
ncbi:hypothetical protein PG985_015456 [Apiospora marii]|uniref:Uncharacterized protein n=1 Tax=Apiospora marii TaxID=335849 RepID=A0ABR1S5R7_9PEZI